ncbi:MAG: diguanylate cyclase [Alphaproteobacteria bacterium]
MAEVNDLSKMPTMFQQEMSRLQQTYVGRLKLHAGDFLKFKTVTTPDKKDIQGMYKLAAMMAASGGTFGFNRISQAGRDLRSYLKPWLAHDITPAQAREISTDIKLRLSALDAACQEAMAQPAGAARLLMPEAPALQLTEGENDIYIIPNRPEPQQSEYVGEQLTQFGFNVIMVEDETQFRDAFRKGHMKAALVFTGLGDHDVSFIKGLCAQNPGVPVILITPFDDFEARLTAVRIGAQGYFHGKTEIVRIIDKIDRISMHAGTITDYHVLIVDDDEMLADFYKQVVLRAGMKATVVHNPKEVLGALTYNDVDLMMMDYDMPGCSGRELASVVRQCEEYVGIPIVFMAAEDDMDEVARDTGLAVDEFLPKPFTAKQLLATIRTRVRRADDLHAFMVRDTFTGLFNHEHFLDVLTQEILRTRRNKDSGCYAVIDIDRFRDLNNDFGHHAGDMVIKGLSHMLRHHVRRTDIVGRCGGQEFGIILPGCDLVDAQDSIEKFRRKFTDSFFDVRSQKIRVTFSAGISLIDGQADADGVIKAAEAALAAAKRRGRNRIVAGDPGPIEMEELG